MIPGAFPGMVGHGGWPGAVITQPPFEGFGHRVPDFMWISRHSGALEPVLIAIEAPGKGWLVDEKNPRQSAELTQALNQFRQWDEWLQNNQEVFFKTFAIPPEWRARRFLPRYLLIYGRRGENDAEIAKLRQYIHQTTAVTAITYDHLAPLHRQSSYISVKSDGAGLYTAVGMAATARLSPQHPDWWQIIHGRDDMVRSAAWISDERRDYLLEHLARCDAWGKRLSRDPQRGVRLASRRARWRPTLTVASVWP